MTIIVGGGGASSGGLDGDKSMFPFDLSQAEHLTAATQNVHNAWLPALESRYILVDTTEYGSSDTRIILNKDITDVTVYSPYSTSPTESTTTKNSTVYRTISIARPSDGHRVYLNTYNTEWVRVIREANGYVIYSNTDVPQRIPDTDKDYDDPNGVSGGSTGIGDYSGYSIGSSYTPRQHRTYTLTKSTDYDNYPVKGFTYLTIALDNPANSSTLAIKYINSSNSYDYAVRWTVTGSNAGSALTPSAGFVEINRTSANGTLSTLESLSNAAHQRSFYILNFAVNRSNSNTVYYYEMMIASTHSGESDGELQTTGSGINVSIRQVF